jgi:hypothetical protein
MNVMEAVEVTLTATMLDKKEDPKQLSSGEFDELYSQTCIPLTGMRNASGRYLDQSILHLQLIGTLLQFFLLLSAS